VETVPDNEISIGSFRIRNRHEYQAIQQLRADAFTSWSDSHPPRFVYNLAARVFQGFLLEARTASGEIVGCLFSAPAFWSGDPGELQTYDYHMQSLRQRPLLKLATILCAGPLRGFEPRLRQALLRRSNCIVLLAMLVQQEYRGQRIPTKFIEHLKNAARTNGYRWLLAPFRPSGYGRYKEETRKSHSPDLFREYCFATGADGLPIDPWLRVLVQNGMKMLRPEPRSMQVTRGLREFEAFRKMFRPERWYQTAAHTWECGEAPTWYTDPFTETAISVEPNLWGMIPVNGNSEESDLPEGKPPPPVS
jgi:GNAT superfamily N-acetyltransferase